MNEIPYQALVAEINRNPQLAKLILQERRQEAFHYSNGLSDEEYYRLEDCISDLRHVYSLEERPRSNQIFALDFKNNEPKIVSWSNLFTLKDIRPDFWMGGIYETAPEAGSFDANVQGYKVRDERFEFDKCGRQTLTDKIGVPTTFISLSESDGIFRVNNTIPSLRFDPTKYR